ncbi:DUF2333 family protein [Nitrosococcus oceani]|uniref:DUF2333 domain-containing protein n=2 Tax=Nitrosococcus oceani TaxID=1229 RepID=Q3J999_NITOC|nr:DUF2333 family protein [Nitrosococcus oceani]KFI18898.1 hypothetical protein IB75_11395 [Nitrosococcus oceani C-27]ABA58597.1 conserved hypothetical protein [Nitrosococcus oceani ATCC 19707]EDZ68133.1 hypothetical protein NOC27_1460 [Nitrosococcus oceani AFC27]KFI22174.1 hypothetical protein HW44_10870 [Nitrosococcus oceani]GEM19717.1 hypothetical protein NONS58_11120 [Nitrosococcus oceani]
MSVTSSIAHKSKEGARRLAWLYRPRTWKEKGLLWTIGLALATYMVIVVILGILWSFEPEVFDGRTHTQEVAAVFAKDIADEMDLPQSKRKELPAGFIATSTAIHVARTLLEKPGGYLSNDVFPPGVYLDNIPNWEFGVLVQLRDFVRNLRNDFSRAQTQSLEDKDLQIADPQFNFNSESWILPTTESQYRKGNKALLSYLKRLSDDKKNDGHFFVRSDNLRSYLEVVEKRLGGLTQRLIAAVGEVQFNVNLAGERQGRSAKPEPREVRVKTSWWEIDDVFYEARGSAWALVHFLHALRIEFEHVLQDKNAEVSLAQVIRSLENSQKTLWSPMILNGDGFGTLANHSLVMASYLAAANAALIDLRNLLKQG